jgi:hypothetical protein
MARSEVGQGRVARDSRFPILISPRSQLKTSFQSAIELLLRLQQRKCQTLSIDRPSSRTSLSIGKGEGDRSVINFPKLPSARHQSKQTNHLLFGFSREATGRNYLEYTIPAGFQIFGRHEMFELFGQRDCSCRSLLQRCRHARSWHFSSTCGGRTH